MLSSKARILAAAILMQSFAGLAHAVDFLTSMEDIPLPEGVVETQAGVTFQSPWGRVIQTTAGGEMSESGAKAFYEGVLPSLGWTASDQAMTFQRGEETLKITTRDNGGNVELTFRLVVQPASSRME